MYTLGMWLKFYLGLKYLRLKSPLKPAKLSDTLHNSSLKHPDNRNYVMQKEKKFKLWRSGTSNTKLKLVPLQAQLYAVKACTLHSPQLSELNSLLQKSRTVLTEINRTFL